MSPVPENETKDIAKASSRTTILVYTLQIDNNLTDLNETFWKMPFFW